MGSKQEDDREETDLRHPSTEHIVQFFEYDHLPIHLQTISMYLARVAEEVLEAFDDGPELTVGLRKLLEAKDCFVRHALVEARTQGVDPAA